MPDRTIINELLQKAYLQYPGAVAVYNILIKEFSVKEPFKYIEIIEEMVSHELVWNNFADLITIKPKGIEVIESGGYFTYLEHHPEIVINRRVRSIVNVKKNPKLLRVFRYFNKDLKKTYTEN